MSRSTSIAAGVRTVLDVCWDGEGQGLAFLAPCLAYTDLFAPSLEEVHADPRDEEIIVSGEGR